jgi:hypothetical protein
MTEQPPGSYPPSAEGFPSPPPGGYPPPAGYWPTAPTAALPKDAYTPWIKRVLAYLIDAIPAAVLIGVGMAILSSTMERAFCSGDINDLGDPDFTDMMTGVWGGPPDNGIWCTASPSTPGLIAISVCSLLALAFVVWNNGYRQGSTGSSIGKSVVKFKVVSEKTGRPIGFGPSLLRQLAHIFDGILCNIGYLFPLWDAKRQTIADKIMSTVCLPI